MTESTLDPQLQWVNRACDAADVSNNPAKNPRALWFRNPTNHQSLRLTRPGFIWFSIKAQFTFHNIELEEGIKSRQLLQLERLFTAPYFIASQKELYLMSEQDAIMLTLHAGNLAQYLDNLQDQK